MATKLLKTIEISTELNKIIETANEYLVFVSPYLKIPNQFKYHIEDKSNQNCNIILIYGKEKLTKEMQSWLNSLKNITVIFNKDLHAKCYFNEKKAIITSMNLYDYSQYHNFELGVLFDRSTEQKLYSDLVLESNRILSKGTIQKESKHFIHSSRKIGSYTLGELYATISNNLYFGGVLGRSGNKLYEAICEYTHTIAHFETNELYLNGRTILRSTTIDYTKGEKILAHFSRIGKPKK